MAVRSGQVETPVSPKVTAAALAGALAVVVTGVAGLFGVTVPGELGTAAGVLLGAVVASVAGWARRDALRDEGQLARDEAGPDPL